MRLVPAPGAASEAPRTANAPGISATDDMLKGFQIAMTIDTTRKQPPMTDPPTPPKPLLAISPEALAQDRVLDSKEAISVLSRLPASTSLGDA